MTKPNILVIDSDEGFGSMLKSGLENSGYYSVEWVETGRQAIRSIKSEQAYDLVILDIGVTDISAYKLVLAIRHFKPDQKLMLIPFFGQDLPDKLKTLEINGILSKPFFVGDLPDLVDDAMGRPRTERVAMAPPPAVDPAPATETASEASAPDAPAEEANVATEAAPLPTVTVKVAQHTIRYLRSNESEVLRILDDLNREVRAEAILLIAGLELIAQAGMLRREECLKLTALVAQSSQAAAEAAKFLGEPEGRFAQSLHEGSEYRLYSLTLSEGILLSLALSSNVPLGMIRHQCRQASEKLSDFIISA